MFEFAGIELKTDFQGHIDSKHLCQNKKIIFGSDLKFHQHIKTIVSVLLKMLLNVSVHSFCKHEIFGVC